MYRTVGGQWQGSCGELTGAAGKGAIVPDIVALGECMIELLSDEPIADALSYRKAFAGDTMNAMFMASKLGASCGYVTRLAEDPFSDYLRA